MNPKVNWFFDQQGKWQDAYQQLRTVVLECGLTEELKWGCPCYTMNDNNIVLIHGFKDYCALLFMKGALLKDQKGILIQQTKNVQAARQIRFSHVDEIHDLEPVIKAYIKEAIKVEKAGLKLPMKKTSAFEMPAEFADVLQRNATLKKAFTALTPGRQRAYLLYFGAAKQSKTRESRIEKYISHILEGKGLDD